jgi:predicted  nucleic acid-binding Zn-ribbon protein
VSASLVIAGLLTGCAEPPRQQLEAAKKGVEAARFGGAEEYAKEDLTKLHEEFTQAKDEIAKQEKTLSVFRSYGKADEMLKLVAEHAKEVEAKATAKREEAKGVAYAREKEAIAVLASTEAMLAQAPVGKDRAAVQTIKQDLSELRGALGPIHDLIEKGDYLAAEAQAKALKDKGTAVDGELQKAIEKAKEGGRSGRSARPKKA